MALTDSDDEILLLHNPRCSKSRAVHAILTEAGVPFRERLYLDQPLSRVELEDLRDRLGSPVAAWLRMGEPEARNAGLAGESDEEKLLDAMAAYPNLIERPIVVRGQRARVGRPPEAVRELL